MNTAINIQGTGPTKESAESMAQLITVIFSGVHEARLSDEVAIKALEMLKEVYGGVNNTCIDGCNITMNG